MKKLLVSLIVIALILMGVTVANAENTQISDRKYFIVNNSGELLSTQIPTTLIRPNKDRVLKVIVSASGNAATSECIVQIFDASAQTYAIDKVSEGEIEADANHSSAFIKYERPLRIFNGVHIVQGSYTTVTVEWEYYRP